MLKSRDTTSIGILHKKKMLIFPPNKILCIYIFQTGLSHQYCCSQTNMYYKLFNILNCNFCHFRNGRSSFWIAVLKVSYFCEWHPLLSGNSTFHTLQFRLWNLKVRFSLKRKQEKSLSYECSLIVYDIYVRVFCSLNY